MGGATPVSTAVTLSEQGADRADMTPKITLYTTAAITVRMRASAFLR